MICLGIDTSNYTTSAAWFDGKTGENRSRLLDVRPGELGLRQSDALFAHVKRLPELAAALPLDRLGHGEKICAIGVSTRPRETEGSYMPCFLAGTSQAETLGTILHVPAHRFSHQQGHLAAALWSSGRMELMERPFLAWHLSGGTTELLLSEPSGNILTARRIGGSTDLSAGQLIDRTGKLLNLPFPSGKSLDHLSREAEGTDSFSVKCPGLEFSLSGVENQVRDYYNRGASPAETAAFALRSIIGAVRAATEHALTQYRDIPVLFSGGVSSNAMLRQAFSGTGAVFCPPEYAADNAMGPAVLAWREERGGSLSHGNAGL